MLREANIFPHEDNKIIYLGREYNFTVLNKEPLILKIHNILDHELCDELIEECKGRLKKSKINSTSEITNIRTSSSMFFERSENKVVTKLENLASHVMNIAKEHGEGIQILNYKPGEEFKSHHDFFKKGTKSAENNRISTLIFYLNDVEEGGETTFPKLNISVSPNKGDAVYFEYFYNEENLNDLTLHTGNPVKKGEKWAATQWMRRKIIN